MRNLDAALKYVINFLKEKMCKVSRDSINVEDLTVETIKNTIMTKNVSEQQPGLLIFTVSPGLRYISQSRKLS